MRSVSENGYWMISERAAPLPLSTIASELAGSQQYFTLFDACSREAEWEEQAIPGVEWWRQRIEDEYRGIAKNVFSGWRCCNSSLFWIGVRSISGCEWCVHIMRHAMHTRHQPDENVSLSVPCNFERLLALACMSLWDCVCVCFYVCTITSKQAFIKRNNYDITMLHHV